MTERYGDWREYSQCKQCGHIIAKEAMWLSAFFVPVCPNCGAANSDLMGWSNLFKPVTVRPVHTRWGRLVRWEFKE